MLSMKFFCGQQLQAQNLYCGPERNHHAAALVSVSSILLCSRVTIVVRSYTSANHHSVTRSYAPQHMLCPTHLKCI
jgi:hypothetical protein